jgi:hypothetical protein
LRIKGLKRIMINIPEVSVYIYWKDAIRKT